MRSKASFGAKANGQQATFRFRFLIQDKVTQTGSGLFYCGRLTPAPKGEVVLNKAQIVEGVKTQVTWWIKQRTDKILASEHETMEINPFLAPLICALHGIDNVHELAEFVIGGHFYIGHGTGFGKLIDEKILPNAFGTLKLSARNRLDGGFAHHAFDNIDQIVTRPDGKYLLSQKAGKWTIQLGQAIELNRSFKTLIDMRADGVIDFKKIIVGTFYGSAANLTDKYRILRGITTGAAHDVVDITSDVEVLAGKEFWAWLGGDVDTQAWIMEGITEAIKEAKQAAEKSEKATEEIEQAFANRFSSIKDIDSGENWIDLLNTINS